MQIVRIFTIVALGLLAGPVLAQSFGLRLDNASRQAVTSLSLFPLDARGEPIEDNLGGLYDPLAPGQQTLVQINAGCGPMLALMMLEDGAELRLKLDTCRDTLLRVTD